LGYWNIYRSSGCSATASQAHCLVAQADTQPKPVKELAYPNAQQTEMM